MKGENVEKFQWYRISSSQVLNFQFFFSPAKTVIFRLLFGIFLARTPKNAVNFVLNFDQWWHTRWWCIRFATALIEVLRNGQNWAKKLIFWLILRGFLFTLSYTLWVTSQDFANWKTLLRYIFGVRVSKFFESIQDHEVAPFWGGFGLYSPKHWLILLIYWLEVVSNKTNTLFDKFIKILQFGSNLTPPILQF